MPIITCALDVVELVLRKPDYRRLMLRAALMAAGILLAMVALGFGVACVYLAIAQALGPVFGALLTAAGILVISLLIMTIASRLGD